MFLEAFAIHSVLPDFILNFAFGNAEYPGCLALIAVSVSQGFLYDISFESRRIWSRFR